MNNCKTLSIHTKYKLHHISGDGELKGVTPWIENAMLESGIRLFGTDSFVSWLDIGTSQTPTLPQQTGVLEKVGEIDLREVPKYPVKALHEVVKLDDSLVTVFRLAGIFSDLDIPANKGIREISLRAISRAVLPEPIMVEAGDWVYAEVLLYVSLPIQPMHYVNNIKANAIEYSGYNSTVNVANVEQLNPFKGLANSFNIDPIDINGYSYPIDPISVNNDELGAKYATIRIKGTGQKIKNLVIYFKYLAQYQIIEFEKEQEIRVGTSLLLTVGIKWGTSEIIINDDIKPIEFLVKGSTLLKFTSDQHCKMLVTNDPNGLYDYTSVNNPSTYDINVGQQPETAKVIGNNVKMEIDQSIDSESGLVDILNIGVLGQLERFNVKVKPTTTWALLDKNMAEEPIIPQSITVETTVWSVSDPTVATINATTGVLTAKKAGNVDVTCVINGNYSETRTVEVQPAPTISVTGESNIPQGTTSQLTYTITPNTAPVNTVVWSSSDPTIAAVDDKGLVTARKVGNCNITCKINDVWVGSTSVQVSPVNIAILTKPYDMHVNEIWRNPEYSFDDNIEIKTVQWAATDTSPTAPFIVDPTTGTVTTLREGAGKLKLTINNIYTTEVQITVLPLIKLTASDITKLNLDEKTAYWKITITPSNAKITGHSYRTKGSSPPIASIDGGDPMVRDAKITMYNEGETTFRYVATRPYEQVDSQLEVFTESSVEIPRFEITVVNGPEFRVGVETTAVLKSTNGWPITKRGVWELSPNDAATIADATTNSPKVTGKQPRKVMLRTVVNDRYPVEYEFSFWDMKLEVPPLYVPMADKATYTFSIDGEQTEG